MEDIGHEAMEDAPGADIEDSDVWVGEGEMPPQYVGISDGMTSVDRTYTGRMSGDVTAQLGDPVEIDQGPFVERGDYVGTLTLDRVEAVESCDTGNGEHFVEEGRQMVQAWFTIDTTESGETFDFSGPNFKAPDDSAENAEEATIGGGYDMWMCQNRPGQPEDVEPGQEVERTLFFDLPTADSPIIYTSGLFDVTWEDALAVEGDDAQAAEDHEEPAQQPEEGAEEVSADTCDALQDEFDQLWEDTNSAEPGSVDHDEFSEQINDIIDRQEAAGCLY